MVILYLINVLDRFRKGIVFFRETTNPFPEIQDFMALFRLL
jgi:hypothetical protein